MSHCSEHVLRDGEMECSPRSPRDPYGNPVGGSSTAAETTIREDQAGRRYVVTPGVVSAARDYFGCPDIWGMPLEDEGSMSSTRHKHWETRLLPYDIMAPSITAGEGARYVVSPPTAALLVSDVH